MIFICSEVGNIGTYTLKYQFKGKILCQYSVNALLIFSFVSSVILSTLLRQTHFESCSVRHFPAKSFCHIY